jgi:PBP1b-binding outer membrane lipoprotein LpoB
MMPVPCLPVSQICSTVISRKEDVLMKSMAIVLVTVAALAAFLGGCCGKTTKVEVTPTPATTTTTGQQLIDLQKAYESGAINKEQYDKMKQDIIDKSAK